MTTKKAVAKTSKEKKAASTLDAVQGLDPATIINQVGELQVSLQNTLAQVSASTTDKIEKLRQLDDAIALKEERLAELFNLDKEALTLEELQAVRAQEDAQWATSREVARKAWQDEESARNVRIKREAEEYDYKTKTERARQSDAFAAEIERQKREEIIRQEALAKMWSDREAALKAQENEVVELRTKVGEFDALLKAAVSKAEAIVGNSMKKDYEMEKKLLEKDIESERKLAAADKAALENRITGLSSQISDLQTQLEAARKAVQETTQRALEASSGREATALLQKAMETNSGAKKS